MNFYFFANSKGNYDSIDNRPENILCYEWEFRFTYDLGTAGQILVTADATVTRRCFKVPTNTYLYISSAIVSILAILYQLLLIKAVLREIIILNYIRDEARQALKEIASVGQRGSDRRSDTEEDEAVSAPASSHPASVDHTMAIESSSRASSSAASASYASAGVHKRSRDRRYDLMENKHLLNTSVITINDGSTENDEDGDEVGDMIRLSQDRLNSHASERSRTQSWWIRERRNSIVEMEQELADIRQSIKALSWSDRLSVFNLWFFLASVGNATVLGYSLRYE
jgi:hypothetical protein